MIGPTRLAVENLIARRQDHLKRVYKVSGGAVGSPAEIPDKIRAITERLVREYRLEIHNLVKDIERVLKNPPLPK